MEILEKKVPSSDGVHTLVGRVYVPDGEIKGIYQVAHGMTEYIDRYDFFMRTICEHGYVVFGYDHLGHGRSVNDMSELGFIAHKNGWNNLCTDIKLFSDSVRETYGKDLPYYLMGHSFGSFIVRVAAARYVTPTKLIPMGTGGPNGAAGIGIVLMSLLKLVHGERGYSNFAENLAFGTYNNHFKDENDPLSWLSKNKQNRITYVGDPYCTFRFTVSAMKDLVTMNKMANDKAVVKDLAAKQFPVLFVSGSEDPVGDYGKGVKTACEQLQAAGCNARMKLFDGYRHEILNEDCAKDVTQTILDFIAE